MINEAHHTKANDESLLEEEGDDKEEYDDNDDQILDQSGVRIKSELFLTSTSVDDNGTFACIAKNSAGFARANFTLHVVVPLDPPPPLVRKNKLLTSKRKKCRYHSFYVDFLVRFFLHFNYLY